MTIKSWKEWYRLFFYGICMGAADIVPGVSGGTMALICGIYEKLIDSIKSLGTSDALSIFKCDFDRFNQKVAWDFLLALSLGIGFSFIIFSQAIHYMLGDPSWRMYLYALFFGMILSSIVVCIWRVPKWERRLWFGVAIGAAATLFVTGFRSEPFMQQPLYEVVLSSDLQYTGEKKLLNYDQTHGVLKNVDEETLAAMWAKGYVDSKTEVLLQGSDQKFLVGNLVSQTEEYWFNPWLFFCGAVAVSAMLLPGISGSFLLMILGAYPLVIAAMADFVKGWTVLKWDADAFSVLINVGLGICVGAIIFSRIIDWFLKKDHDMTIAVLIGFMVGSLRVVWPYQTYAWRLDPLKLLNGPLLVPVEAYTPSIWDAGYWTSALFLSAGLGVVSLLYMVSENAKRN